MEAESTARSRFTADLIPGLTTAAVVVPKALAYATIAQLPVQAGLFAAMVPMAVYAVLGTSRLLSVSTTTPIAILCATAIGEALRDNPGLDPLTAAATLSVLVGLMLIAARILRFGFLANFISEPVLTGFKAGVGFVIVADQVPKLLGIHIHKEGFFRDVVSIFKHAPELSWATLAVALGTFAVIYFAKRFLPKSPAPLLAVAAGIAASAIVGLEAAGVSVVGTIHGGFPMLVLPQPSLFEAMWPAAAGIALISFTESIAAARAFVRRTDPPLDANRELLAIGAANAAGAFIGSMPAGGGTSQTAVSLKAGTQTQATSLVVAAVAFATLLFLAPVLALMPHATLAAVVIAYSIGLVNPAEMAAIRRVRTMEFRWAVVACLGVMMLGTLKGILVAIVLSLLGLMVHRVRPAGRRTPPQAGHECVPPALAGASRRRGHTRACSSYVPRTASTSAMPRMSPANCRPWPRPPTRRWSCSTVPRFRVLNTPRSRCWSRGRRSSVNRAWSYGLPRSTPRHWNSCSARRWRNGWDASGCTSPWNRRSPRSRHEHERPHINAQ